MAQPNVLQCQHALYVVLAGKVLVALDHESDYSVHIVYVILLGGSRGCGGQVLRI